MKTLAFWLRGTADRVLKRNGAMLRLRRFFAPERVMCKVTYSAPKVRLARFTTAPTARSKTGVVDKKTAGTEAPCRRQKIEFSFYAGENLAAKPKSPFPENGGVCPPFGPGKTRSRKLRGILRIKADGTKNRRTSPVFRTIQPQNHRWIRSVRLRLLPPRRRDADR